jgi:hypothetical protein
MHFDDVVALLVFGFSLSEVGVTQRSLATALLGIALGVYVGLRIWSDMKP